LPSGIVNKLYSVAGSSGADSSAEKSEGEVKFDKESGATFDDDKNSSIA